MNIKKELKDIAINQTLLYAEDEDETRNIFTNIFSMLYKEVVSVSNGQEALDEYNRCPFDLVITDLTMPIMSGVDLIREIKKLNINQKIIVATAHNTGDELINSINIQVDGILIKPIDMNMLISMLYKISKDIYLNKKFDISNKNLKIFNIDLDVEIKIGMIIIDEYVEFMERFGDDTKDFIYEAIQQHLTSLGLSDNIIYIKDDILLFTIFDHTEIIISALESFSKNRRHLHVRVNNYILQIVISYAFMITKLEVQDSSEKEAELLRRVNSLAKVVRDDEKSSYIVNVSINDELRDKEDSFKWLDIINDSFSNNSILPFYQPIYDLESSKIFAYEVLARIKYKDRFIPPSFFIDLSKKAGILNKLSKILFEKSFLVFINNNYSITINIDESLWDDDAFEEYLIYICKHNKISNDRVIININNYGNFSATSEIAKRLKILKSFGFKIAITNLNNKSIDIELFSILKPDIFRVDKILLDRSLIDEDYKNLLKSVVSFINSLNLTTIAVGVESKDVFELSKEINFNMIQGYYVKEPISNLLSEEEINSLNI